MGIKKICLALPLLPLLLLFSCGTDPEIQETIQPAAPSEQRQVITTPQITEQPAAVEQEEEDITEVEPIAEAPAEEVFNPESISEERYIATRTEVQTLIAELNRIIRAQNYNLWITFLSESYYAQINSRAFLDAIAAQPAMAARRITLNNARDYFLNVVVPSRQNDRVDDIDFVSDNRVIAYTINAQGNRLVLYNLEVINNEWKIVN